MRVDYVCIVTLEERDVRLAATNGGLTIEHPVAPVRTTFRVSNEVRDSLIRGTGDSTEVDRDPLGGR